MGTWTLTEIPESRSQTWSVPGDEHQFELVYLVTWTPSSGVDTFPGDGYVRDQLPTTRTRLNSSIRGSDYLLRRMVLRNIELAPVRERTYTWRATLRYGTYANAGDWEWGQVTRNSQSRQTNMWRRGASFPANGDVTWPAGVVDIGGTKVDLNGNPKPFDIGQQQITVEYLWDRTYVVAGSPQAEPPAATWASYISTRNNADYLGCPNGTLLYQGFQVAPLHEWYRIQHSFLYDPWYHLEQVAAPVPTGAPLCTKSAVTVMGLDVLQADKIGWFQRYDRTSWTSLLPSTALSDINSPIPAAV